MGETFGAPSEHECLLEMSPVDHIVSLHVANRLSFQATITSIEVSFGHIHGSTCPLLFLPPFRA